MAFELLETSRDQGIPINLFLFRYGTAPGAFYAYTDHEEAVIEPIQSITYEPVPIMRGPLVSSGTLDKTNLEIRTHQDSQISELFKVYPPAHTVTLTIRQGHSTDTEFLVVWAGRILSCSREGNEAKLTAEPISTSMRRPGLRRHWMYGCPHVLYGPECRADKNAATVVGQVFGIASYAVTLRNGWQGANDPGKFLGGMLEWAGSAGTESRTIVRITGDTLFLSGPPRDLGIGDLVNVVRGCAHTMEACLGDHNNIHNYGGQAWIPYKNPIGLVNNFY
jgi:hypothetical protein